MDPFSFCTVVISVLGVASIVIKVLHIKFHRLTNKAFYEKTLESGKGKNCTRLFRKYFILVPTWSNCLI